MGKILIFFLIFTSSLFSQTRLDSLVLSEINDYRASLKLILVTFSKDCYIISEAHSKKLVETKDSLYHSDNFIGAEVTLILQDFRISVDEKEPDVILAKEIVNSWKKSPKHNTIIKSLKYKFAGVSTKMVYDKKLAKVWSKDEQKFKSVYLYKLFSTMNFK